MSAEDCSEGEIVDAEALVITDDCREVVGKIVASLRAGLSADVAVATRPAFEGEKASLYRALNVSARLAGQRMMLEKFVAAFGLSEPQEELTKLPEDAILKEQ